MSEQELVAEASARLGLVNAREIARGGQKIVLLAERGVDDVVLKVVETSASPDPNSLERCRREVELLLTVSSPHIVRVLSPLGTIGDPPECAFWLEEYLPGQDFSQLVGPQWDESEAIRFMFEVASGLATLHEGGYVHRDLSAGNVRRLDDGTWKVMDPGYAKHLTRSSITGLAQPGTLGYISPEHAVIGGRVTPASDVFCLGILTFTALVGRSPIPTTPQLNDYRRQLLQGAPIRVQEDRPAVDGEVANIVNRCLERQGARRYFDAGEVLEDLAPLMGRA